MDGGRGRSAAPGVALAAVAVLGTALAATFAVVVPPGLPYDEPAHWANVLFYAEHWRLPTLGEPGTRYEAQMGPVYYTLSALLVHILGADDPERAFWVARGWWLVLVPLLVVLTARLGRAAAPRSTPEGRYAAWQPAVVAAALVAVNPLLLVMGGSIQNDHLALTLGCAAALVGVRALRSLDPGRPTASAVHLAAGALVGLAVLTKVFALGLLVGLLVGYLAERRAGPRQRATAGLLALTGFSAVAGWWFLRNVVEYGDLTGQSALDEAGYTFPPLLLEGPASLVAWGRSLVSYLFVPTEYYRNDVASPGWLDAVAAATALMLVVGLLVAAGAVVARRRSASARPPSSPVTVFLATSIAVTLIAYAASAWGVQSVAPRLAFAVAPLGAVLAARLLWRGPGRWVVVLCGVVFLVADAWLLGAVLGLSPSAYRL